MVTTTCYHTMKYPSTKSFCSISFPPIQRLLNLPPWYPMAYGGTVPLLSAYEACIERVQAVYEGIMFPRLISKHAIKPPG